MGKILDAIDLDLKTWLEAQHIYFVATAPLWAGGHVNCSPKGGDTFRVLDDKEVAYLDRTASGIETIAHVQENCRIVLMFCAFEGPPKIVRLHGCGEVVYPHEPRFINLTAHFPHYVGTRAIIRITLDRISDSCGFNVPLFDFVGPRYALDKWTENKGSADLIAYRQKKNSFSIDGLVGYTPDG
jgi:hypothetical protein